MSTYSKRSMQFLESMSGQNKAYHATYAGISNSTGLSDTAMVLDHSGGIQEYIVSPPAGEVWEIARGIILVRDNGTLRADTYGAASALTNGISFQCKVHGTGEVLQDLTAFDPVKDNGSWAAHCYDISEHSFGAGDNFLGVRWTFSKSGRPLTLDGSESQYLAIILNDDFTDLVDHRMKFEGTRRKI